MRLALSAAVLALAPSARAADPAWKWDKPFYVECVVDSRTSLAAAGQPADEGRDKARLVFRVTPEPKPDGAVRLAHAITAAARTEEAGGRTVAKPTFPRMVGGAVAVTRGADGRLTRVEGVPELVERAVGKAAVAAADRKVKAQVEGTFEAMFRVLLSEAYFPLPPAGDPAGVKAAAEAQAAGLFALKLEKTYTAAGTGEAGGKTYPRYRMAAAVALTPPAEGMAGSPFKVVAVEPRKPPEYAADILFDPAAGRPVRYARRAAYDLALTYEIDGRTVKVGGTETQTLTVRFSDTAPAEKPGD